MILILSPSSAASRNVRNEISLAIDSGKDIFPVLNRSCELPLQVRRLQYVDFRYDYQAGLAALIGKLTGVSAPTPKSRGRFRRRWWLFAAALSLSIALLFWVLRPEPVIRQPASLSEPKDANSSRTTPGMPVVENQAAPPTIAQRDVGAPSQHSKAPRSKAASNGESRPKEAGLRLEIEDMKQATPIVEPDQPHWNGEPVWCDTAVFNLMIAHNRTVPDPLLVNDLGIHTERVAVTLPDSVDCSIDTLNSKPFGIVVVNQYAFDLSPAGLSGRFIKSGRMGDASPVDPESLLHLRGEKLAITLQPGETPTPFNISVHARAPGVYRVWFTAEYDQSGPGKANSQSFLLAK